MVVGMAERGGDTRGWHAEMYDDDDVQEREIAILRAADSRSARPLAVTPIMVAARMPEPAELLFVSLTEWTTYSEMHWVFRTTAGSSEIDLRLQAGLEWSCVDDLGNNYEGTDQSRGGNSPLWRAYTWLVPALAPEAARLTVRCLSPVDQQALVTELPLLGRASGA
jgi:hypothetical protein